MTAREAAEKYSDKHWDGNGNPFVLENAFEAGVKWSESQTLKEPNEDWGYGCPKCKGFRMGEKPCGPSCSCLIQLAYDKGCVAGYASAERITYKKAISDSWAAYLERKLKNVD